jgi:hypothetical protein
MSNVGMIFGANLNADKIYIDYSNLPNPVLHKFFLKVQNQSISTLYFRILSYIDNWSISDPSNGQLGSIGSSSTNTYTITMSRSKPTGEATDTGYLRIQAFTDSSYSNKVGEVDLNVTVYIEDLENWTNATINSFDDGTAQGWTLASGMTVANDRSIEAGGYSIKTPAVAGTTSNFYIYKNITLPDNNKVRINFYKSLYFQNTSASNRIGILSNLSVKANNNKIFDIPLDIITDNVSPSTTHNLGWYKFTADLSAYKGQTVTLRIEWQLYSSNSSLTVYSWLDRIVIAGKN